MYRLATDQTLRMLEAHAPELAVSKSQRLKAAWPLKQVYDEPTDAIKPLMFLSTINHLTCSSCGGSDKTLRWCTRCFTRAYCSLKCQRDHWKAEHRCLCVAPVVADGEFKLTISSHFLEFWAKAAIAAGREGEIFCEECEMM